MKNNRINEIYVCSFLAVMCTLFYSLKAFADEIVIPPMNYSHVGAPSVVLDDKLYVCSSYLGDGSGKLEVYDPAVNTWTALSSMPSNRIHAGSFALNENIYILGGTPSDTVYKYTPATDTWRQMNNLPKSVRDVRCAVSNGKAYLICHADSTNHDYLVYDEQNDAWASEHTPATEYLTNGAGVETHNGKIYIFGNGAHPPHNPTQVTVYDPVTKQVRYGTPIPESFYHNGTAQSNFHYVIQSVSHDNKAFLFCYTWVGSVQLNPMIYVYSYVTDTWESFDMTPYLNTDQIQLTYGDSPSAINGIVYFTSYNNGSKNVLTLDLNNFVSSPPIVDSDGDGLSDEDEVNIHNTNPNNIDSDNDGLTDYEEVVIYNTDPLNPFIFADSFDLIDQQVNFHETVFLHDKYLIIFDNDGLFGQFVHENGNLSGDAFLISDSSPVSHKALQAESSEFGTLVVWAEVDGGGYQLNVQPIFYGEDVDPARKISLDGYTTDFTNVAVAYNGYHYLIAWNVEEKFGLQKIYGKLVGKYAEYQSEKILLNTEPAYGNVALASDGTNFLLAYQSESSEDNIVCQLISSGGEILNKTYVPFFEYGLSDIHLDVQYCRDRYLITWETSYINIFNTFEGQYLSNSGSLIGSKIELSFSLSFKDGSEYLSIQSSFDYVYLRYKEVFVLEYQYNRNIILDNEGCFIINDNPTIDSLGDIYNVNYDFVPGDHEQISIGSNGLDFLTVAGNESLKGQFYIHYLSDSDGDGLRTVEEIRNATNYFDNDSDDDSLTDGDEVLTYGTNPLDNDTDGDLMPDAVEIHYGFSPAVYDSDQDADLDGVSNLEEYQFGTDMFEPGPFFKTADMNYGHTYGQTVEYDGKLYVMGGQYQEAGSKLEVYNPAVNQWTVKAELPAQLRSFEAFELNGKIYCIGGIDDEILNEVFRYDPITDTWQTMNPLPVPMASAHVAAVDDKAYIVAGWQRFTGEPFELSYLYEYDETNDSWIEQTAPPLPVGQTAVVSYNGKIYVFGGIHQPHFRVYENRQEVQVYDPATDLWEQGTPLPDELFEHPVQAAFEMHAVVYGDKAYVFADVLDLYMAGAEQRIKSDMYVYSFVTDTWQIVDLSNRVPLNFVWMNLYNGVGHIGDTAYFLCNEEQTDVYRFNLLHASTEIASTHYEHTGGTMVAYDGKLYLAGAYSWNDSQFMSGREKLEIYDPSNNTWREGADLPDYRCFMGAFVLDEQIYFLGGQRTQGYPQNNVWKYDPLTGVWDAGLPMLPGSVFDIRTVILDNTPYMVHGGNFSGDLLDTYRYEKNNGSWSVTYNHELSYDMRSCTSQTYDGKIYYFGSAYDQTSKVKIYDISTGIASYGTDIPPGLFHNPSGGHTINSVVYDNKVFVFSLSWAGESSLQGMNPNVYVYSFEYGIWNVVDISKNIPLKDIEFTYGAGLALLGDYVYFYDERDFGKKVFRLDLREISAHIPQVVFHPADTNHDLAISLDEETAYSNAWKTGQVWSDNIMIDINFVTNAGYIFMKGGSYTFDTDKQKPQYWIPSTD